MSKTFAVAGVSTLNGACKVRFANDMTRVKVLAKNGHKDIDLVELKHPMTKEDAIAYLIKANFDQGNAKVKAALEAAQDKRAEKPAKVKAAKAAKPAKVKAPKVAAPQPELTGGKPVGEDENAPF
jgi:hypothetical protein